MTPRDCRHDESYYQRHRERCLAYARAYRALHKDVIKARAAGRRWAAVDTTPLLAHCNAWHAVTAMPWRCPACGYTLGEGR